MGDKDGTDLGEAQPRTAQLHLGTLAAVYEKQLATHFDHLRRGIVTQGGQSTAATQDMNFERFQTKGNKGLGLHEEFVAGILQFYVHAVALLGLLA